MRAITKSKINRSKNNITRAIHRAASLQASLNETQAQARRLRNPDKIAAANSTANALSARIVGLAVNVVANNNRIGVAA